MRLLSTATGHSVCALALAAAAAWCTPAAHAGLVNFSFDDDFGLPYRSSSSPGGDSVTDAIEAYMQKVWEAAGLSGVISVTGAGQLSNNRYTGDDHVVGPEGTCRRTTGQTYACVTPATLGSTDGGVQGSAALHDLGTTAALVDNYIVNRTNTDRIVIEFPIPVYFAAFDFQIFPDGTCTDDVAKKCGGQPTTAGDPLPHWPDFKFVADGVQQFLQLATVPGDPGTYCESPISISKDGCEKAPQYLGVSGDRYLPGGATKLEFVDWPRRIGIDNLVVNTDCCALQVPEPGSVALIGASLAAFGLMRRRDRVGGPGGRDQRSRRRLSKLLN